MMEMEFYKIIFEKILKISGKYLFLDSYDSNNKKEGIKVFLISEIKRVILKSDYIEKLETKC